MDLEEYTLAIGKIIVNLHSLEFALRSFLWNHQNSTNLKNRHNTILQLKVGQEVPADAFSNYDTLNELIKKFNKIVRQVDSKFSLDQSIVDLRDALAHGRIWAEDRQLPMQLVKFAKENKGMVKVTHVELINDEWLKSQQKRVSNEIAKVIEASSQVILSVRSVDHL